MYVGRQLVVGEKIKCMCSAECGQFGTLLSIRENKAEVQFDIDAPGRPQIIELAWVRPKQPSPTQLRVTILQEISHEEG